VGLGFLGYALCHDLSETRTSCLGTTLGTAAVGAVIGGVTGALIGGAFRKQGPADSTTAGP
jgi:predicted membrane protein